MDQEYYEDADYEEGEEIEIEAIGVEVSSQPIELYKVFKIANLVGGGGEAKHVISEGYVAVNGELETRKRRKMYDGDFFEFNQEYYVVVCDVPVQEEPQEKPAVKAEDKRAAKDKRAKSKSSKNKKSALSASADKGSKKKSKNTKSDKPKSQPQRDEKSGRNSIDFF